MRVTVTSEQRFLQTPDGSVFTPSANEYQFWCRYLTVFDSVRVVARVWRVEKREAQWNRADGVSVEFVALPYYVGPYEFLRRRAAIQKALRALSVDEDAVIMRSGIIADRFERILRKLNRPFALEVVGDPYDVFSPGAYRHLLRPFFRMWASASQRRLCKSAVGVAYVTKHALQRRYPNRALMVGISDVIMPQLSHLKSAHALSTHDSSINLKPSDVAQRAREDTIDPQNLKTVVICVGAFQELYKGQDILIRAVATCVKMGDDVVLKLVGDGKNRGLLKSLANHLGICNRCHFLGELSQRDAVIRELDSSDIFALPSRQEGLPRAMIEAMARGLPCIGTRVGGIPELLTAEALVPPNDLNALAGTIHKLVNSSELRARLSSQNLERAKDYTEENLRERRVEFYEHVRDATAAWNAKAGSC
jgi:glycosyltransferase involved in cell wall biosynthesis